MANRTIQAQERKIKKYKRLAPKKYYASYVHVNIPRSPEFFGKPSGGRASLFMRGTTSHKEAEFLARQHAFAAMFPGWFGYQTPEPRKEAQRRWRIEKTLEGICDVHHIVLKNNVNYKFTLHFSEDRKRIFLVHADYNLNTIRTSHSFGSTDEAKRAYLNGYVRWKKAVSVDSPPESSS